MLIRRKASYPEELVMAPSSKKVCGLWVSNKRLSAYRANNKKLSSTKKDLKLKETK